MSRYILRRLLIAVPTLLVISFVVFAILALAPTDPMASFGADPRVPPEVRERIREVGILKTLGYTPGAILFMILGEGALMAAIGLAIGGIAAIPLSRAISGLLFEVKPVDPLTIVFAAFLLVVVALAASMFPARRATAVDPIVALRRQ